MVRQVASVLARTRLHITMMACGLHLRCGSPDGSIAPGLGLKGRQLPDVISGRLVFCTRRDALLTRLLAVQ